MVQTKAGSRNNPWLEHLRQCAAEYHKRRAAEHASSSEEHREDKPIRRRVVGKRPEAKATTAPPKDKAKTLTEKVTKNIIKTLKDKGKQAKTKKAAEADNPQ